MADLNNNGDQEIRVIGPSGNIAEVTTTNRLQVDVASSSGTELETIDHIHQQIHDGLAYTISHYYIVNKNTSVNLVVEVNSAYELHTSLDFSASISMYMRLYENPTYTNGTIITANNLNRNSTNISTSVFKYGVNVTANGTLLKESHIFGTSNNKSGGITGTVSEWILKPGGKYIWIISNDSSADGEAELSLQWYRKAI